MARIVIVSNRVPIPKSRVPAAGGLTVALRDLLIPGSMWFGWSGRLAPEPSLQPALVEARGVTYATVDLTSEAHRAFYVGFANGALWPLLHFRLGLMHYRREDYLGYLSVNQTFATALGHVLQPDDTVWAHDYHLLPLGRMLRQQGFSGPLGFFLHVPFVPPSMLEAMPVAREMVADLCAYDVVGFQTEEHARDFRDCAQRLLGAMVDGEWVRLNGRRVRAFADPIGIDAQAFAEEAERSANDKLVQRVAGSLVGRLLAIGVDRMDYSKGLPNRFEAYGRLLERYPEHRRQHPLPADLPALARGGRRISPPARRARPADRPHQRPLLGVRLDAAALLDAAGAARDPGRPLPHQPHRRGDAAARRHEPGGQGVRRRPARRRSRACWCCRSSPAPPTSSPRR